MFKIDVEQAQCLLAVRPLPEEFALRPSHKTGSPKLDATRAGLSLRLAHGRRLEAHPVDSDDRKSVGHSMAAHHGGPRRALALLLLLDVGGFIADGRRVDQNLCPLQGHQARCLWIPLVPADQHTQATHTRVDGTEAEVARSKVKLLVVGRIVGDVHLAILARDGSVALYHHGRVVIETCRAALKERRDDDDAQTPGQFTIKLSRWAGDRLRQVEVGYVLRLAEVERVVQLLQYDELRPLLGQLLHRGSQTAHVVRHVGSIVLLYDSYFHCESCDIFFDMRADEDFSPPQPLRFIRLLGPRLRGSAWSGSGAIRAAG